MNKFSFLIGIISYFTLLYAPLSAQVLLPHIPVIGTGNVFASATKGDTLYIGGSFTQVGYGLRHLATVNTSNGQPARGFPYPNGPVQTTISDGAGGWYIGGNFNMVGDSARSRIAHINSLGEVTAWNPVANDFVRSIILSGNTLYVGGDFTTIGGQNRNHMAAIDATTGAVTSWNPDANGIVLHLLVSGNTVYAGGNFTTIGGQNRNRIAAIDITTNAVTAWNPNADNDIYVLELYGSTMFVGGSFSAIGGENRNHIAALDITTGNATTWNPNASSTVWAFARSGNTLYVGGTFNTIGGIGRNRIAAVDATNGNISSWNPNSDNNIQALSVSGNTVYAGGYFNNIGGQARNFLAALDATTGLATSWMPNPSAGGVRAIALAGSSISIGGEFTSIGVQTRNRIAAIRISTGEILDWNPDAGTGSVRSLVVSGNTVYVGGAFSNIGGQPRNRIAALNANIATNNATAWNPNANANVWTLALSGNTLYAGGEFTSINGQTRNRIAAIDTATGNATSWDPGANNIVYAIAASGNLIYAGGTFTTIGGQSRNRLAALDVLTGSATAWNPDVNSQVSTIVLSGNTLYAGGAFTNIGGQTRNRIAALDVLTGSVTAWNPDANNTVNTIALSGNTIYAGGAFTNIGGQTRNGIAALNADVISNYTTVWNPNPNPNGGVWCISISGNNAFVGGGFTSIATQIRRGLAGLTLPPPCHATNIIYVDSAATGANNGTSWANAFTNLSSAISLAHSCSLVDSILVAKGTYYPDSIPATASVTTGRDRTFYFHRDNLAVIGGYPNSGGTRNVLENATILSGDLDQSGTATVSDAYHVILAIGTATTPINNTLVFDGLTIRGGQGNIGSTIFINSHEIPRNSGAGMYHLYASPTINNTNILGNTCGNFGAGMYNEWSSPIINNTKFSGNNAANGGGMYNDKASPRINNSLFTGNISSNGAAMSNVSTPTAPHINNSVFSGNYASSNGAAMHNFNGTTPTISNTIIHGNNSGIRNLANAEPVYSYSLIQGLSNTNDGNIDGSNTPLFVDAPAPTMAPFEGGNYHLQFCSPAINAGRNDSIPTGVTTDLFGKPRITGSIVDMGAYEKQSDVTSFANNASLSQSSSNSLNFVPTCEENGWTWYASPNNPDSLSFAVQWGTNNNTAKAAAVITLDVANSHFVASNNIDAAVVTMKRFWNVNLGSHTLVDPVAIRFFFHAADTTEMRATANALNVGSAHSLEWFKTLGTPYNTNVVAYNAINNGNSIRLTPTYGSANGVTYVQFNNLTSFSGGTAGIGVGIGSALPVDLLSFSAVAVDNHKTKLTWNTANERHMHHIEVERSATGSTWNTIAKVTAKGGAIVNSYEEWDNTPISGINLYRLKLVDHDGTVNYSHIEQVHFKLFDFNSYAVYPNPTSGHFTIDVTKSMETSRVFVYDALGRKVHTQTIETGSNKIAPAALPPGLYLLQIVNNQQVVFEQKLIVK